MQYISPITITDAMLLSSNVIETDYVEWDAVTSWGVGARVIRTATHRVYQRVVAGVSATPPEADPLNWDDISPTNRWAMLDGAIGSRTLRAGTITLTLAPGQIVEGLALLDLDVDQITITCTSAGSVVYSRFFDAQLDTSSMTDWYRFFFATLERRNTLVLTDLPPYRDMQISVTLTVATGSASCGTLAIGRVYDIGDLLAGAGITIDDYAGKATTTAGITTIVDRGAAIRMTCRTRMDRELVDATVKRIRLQRATPAVWIGSPGYESTVIYGPCKNFAVDLAFPTFSHCSFRIESLTA